MDIGDESNCHVLTEIKSNYSFLGSDGLVHTGLLMRGKIQFDLVFSSEASISDGTAPLLTFSN